MAIITGLSGNEIFCLQRQGLTPGDLVIGNSVIALGLIGSISSGFKTLFGGEISELTTLIYKAREEALTYIAEDARRYGADQVVGIKAYVYNLGGGIIEFLAIGTAVKKMPGVRTQSDALLPQAIIRDQDTFINTAETTVASSLNQPTNSANFVAIFVGFGVIAFYILFILFRIFVVKG